MSSSRDYAASSSEAEDSCEDESDSENDTTTLKLKDAFLSESDGGDSEEKDDLDEELPPILEPPSTGYLHSVNENQPPPDLHPATGGLSSETLERITTLQDDDSSRSKTFEVVDLRESDEGSSNTDSDDELVKVDYAGNPPEAFKDLLLKYKFLSSKENWMHTVKTLYKKQPSNIKRLLKLHRDVDGNPVEQPIEMLFEKIHAERERIKRAQNVKCERDEIADDGVATVVSVKVPNTAPKLTHIMYPANVVNNEKVLETLGGMGVVSKTFQQPNKKLVLKFRPHDPYANGATASGRNACGLLIKIRRRKIRNDSTERLNQESLRETDKINLDLQGPEPLSTGLIHDMLLDNQLQIKPNEREDNAVTLYGKKYGQEDLLREDKLVSEDVDQKAKTKRAWKGERSKEYNLKLPKILETKQDSSIQVETLGVVYRSYEFNGMCDFQYLPVRKKPDGKMVSIKDRIFPVLGTADNLEKLVMKEFISEENPCQTFSLPPSMSRIDNSPRGLIEELIISEKADSGPKRMPPEDSVFSNRMKRIIYTVSYNFLADANTSDNSQKIPSQPLSLALKDIERRQIKKDVIEIVRMKFEERPIWSKVALEFATKVPSQTLKYIIPNFAYFATNGPWRNTWIKFGLDPRKNPIYSIYQSVDFRIPFIYRGYMSLGSKSTEANHKFLAEHVPPKTQMFYQLCDIKIFEVKELIQTLEMRAASKTLSYDERYGFLKEGSYEYFRYIMNYYLENLLQDFGKIPATNSSDVSFIIPPGHIEPEEKVKAAPHRRVKTKRIRKSARKAVDLGTSPAQTKLSKGKMAKPSAYQSRQEIPDLALNNLQSESGSDREVEFFDDDEEDYSDE